MRCASYTVLWDNLWICYILVVSFVIALVLLVYETSHALGYDVYLDTRARHTFKTLFKTNFLVRYL